MEMKIDTILSFAILDSLFTQSITTFWYIIYLVSSGYSLHYKDKLEYSPILFKYVKT